MFSVILMVLGGLTVLGVVSFMLTRDAKRK